MLPTINSIFFAVTSDFFEWIDEAIVFLQRSSAVHRLLTFSLLAILLVRAFYISESPNYFYYYTIIIFLEIILAYFVWQSSLAFWYIVRWLSLLKWITNDKKFIDLTVKFMKKNGFFDKKEDPFPLEGEEGGDHLHNILSEMEFRKKNAVLSGVRYLCEVAALVLLSRSVNPGFFVINLTISLFVGAYLALSFLNIIDMLIIYIRHLAWNIYKYNNRNPKACRQLIMAGKRMNISNLRNIYLSIEKNCGRTDEDHSHC